MANHHDAVRALGTLYREVARVDMPDVAWVADLVPPHAISPALSEHALHDACFATRWLKKPTLRAVYAPKSAAPHAILEGESGCCGGMLLPFYDPATADAVARRRVAELTGTTARRIVSPSPTCSRRLRQVQAPVDDLLALWHRGTSGPDVI